MSELNDQAILQKNVEMEKTQNDLLQLQIERLRVDKSKLVANKTALGEGNNMQIYLVENAYVAFWNLKY